MVQLFTHDITDVTDVNMGKRFSEKQIKARGKMGIEPRCDNLQPRRDDLKHCTKGILGMVSWRIFCSVLRGRIVRVSSQYI